MVNSDKKIAITKINNNTRRMVHPRCLSILTWLPVRNSPKATRRWRPGGGTNLHLLVLQPNTCHQRAFLSCCATDAESNWVCCFFRDTPRRSCSAAARSTHPGPRQARGSSETTTSDRDSFRNNRFYSIRITLFFYLYRRECMILRLAVFCTWTTDSPHFQKLWRYYRAKINLF